MSWHNDEFWEFMHERENIRLARLQGKPREEWTNDPIFKSFSFTNVKRIHDRTTAQLFQQFYNVNRKHPSKQALLNSAIFRYHGTYATAMTLGWFTMWGPSQKEWMIKQDELRLAEGKRVFTAAYIIPNCGDPRQKHLIVADIIDSIYHNADNILMTNSWEVACNRLCSNWGVGPFMAKEVLLDYILCTGWVPNDWETWTPVGPGGRRGAGYVVNGVPKGISETESLIVIRKLYAERMERWHHEVSLDLTDIQFQLCELAKYKKAQLGLGQPKRHFYPTSDGITTEALR